MRSVRVLGGVGLLIVFVVLLVASAPARLLSLVLPGQQVVMAGFEGTLWSGSASRCMLLLPPGYLHLGGVSWSLSPLSLITLSPALTVQSQWGAQRVEGEIVLRSTSAMDVRNFEADIGADLIQKFAPLAVDGRVSVLLQQFSVRDGLPYSADGQLAWKNAEFLGPTGRVSLGSYAANFTQDAGGVLSGEVVTLQGPLTVEGDVRLEGRNYGVDLHLSSDGQLDTALQQALALMAVPQGDGFNLTMDSSF
jgi:general secretion pathway protein N